jgi:hypothetical protein
VLNFIDWFMIDLINDVPFYSTFIPFYLFLLFSLDCSMSIFPLLNCFLYSFFGLCIKSSFFSLFSFCFHFICFISKFSSIINRLEVCLCVDVEVQVKEGLSRS